MHFRLLFALCIVAISPGVAAQTPPAADADTAVVVAPNTCVKPPFSGRLASDPNLTIFNRQFKAYGECVKKYVDQNKAIANSATAAANRAVDEYNAYTAEIKEKIEAK
jgi:hypothetical protein